MSVKAIPDGYPRIIPHVTLSDTASAVAFYEKAFDAKTGHISKTPDGKVMHAEIRIGDSVIFLNDEFRPQAAAPAGFVLTLRVEDADAVWNRAVQAGAKVTMPLENQFWGDRYGHVIDPFGITWAISTHIEDVSPEEMNRRAIELFSKMGG